MKTIITYEEWWAYEKARQARHPFTSTHLSGSWRCPDKPRDEWDDPCPCHGQWGGAYYKLTVKKDAP